MAAFDEHDLKLPPGTWPIDPRRSSARFAAANLRVRRVRGRLRDIDGVIEIGKDGTMSASGTAQAASIHTGIGMRDWHLRGKDFLHAGEHPTIDLRVSELHGHGDHLHAGATVTIRGVSREVPLTVSVEESPDEDTLHLHATGSFDREDFEIRAISFMVGREIDIELDLYAVKT
jgi:polyisoprenoid-binding protein YceI